MTDFDLQPTLRGKLLELHPLRESDFDALYAVASDPLIWEQHPASDRYQEPVFRQFFREAMASGGAFKILDASSGEVIGSSRYFGLDVEASSIEIGWTFLARRYWGGAHNGELKQLMLEHAYRHVNRVIFLVGPQNFRSQRALEKIGAVHVGVKQREGGAESNVYEMKSVGAGHRPARPGST